MRKIVVVIISLLLLLQLGRYFPRPDECASDGAALDCDEGPARSDSVHSIEPSSIEDRSLLAHLVREGTILLEQGRLAEMDTLIEQLDNPHCQLDLPDRKSTADDPVEIYAKARDGVVVVGGLYKCKRCTKWHASAASGFVITATGAVVTNYHVIDNPDKKALVVMTSDRRVFPVERVLAANRTIDLAILKVGAKGLKPLPVAVTTDAARVGAPIGVISHPARRFYCFTSGVISRYMRIRSEGEEIDALSITADYAHGSSGAPVLNREGQVVAVVKSTESIYSSVGPGKTKNLQMVFKTCLPAKHLLQLIEG
jgi:S1-C subfamily serine protease